jgi:hypothetical protein
MNQLTYLKEKDKKKFKINNILVIILSNLSKTMSHPFIFHKTQLPTPINLDSNSLKGENVKSATIIELIPNSLEDRFNSSNAMFNLKDIFKWYKCGSCYNKIDHSKNS